MTKLNIMRIGGDYLNGYINITPTKNEEHLDASIGSLNNVDWIVDNGELEEIIADKVLEYFPYSETATIISNWVSKLKVGGTIVIGIIDTYELTRMLSLRSMDLSTYNNIANGAGPDYKKASLSTQDIIDKVTYPHSLKLIEHTLKGVDSTLTFRRYQ